MSFWATKIGQANPLKLLRVSEVVKHVDGAHNAYMAKHFAKGKNGRATRAHVAHVFSGGRISSAGGCRAECGVWTWFNMVVVGVGCAMVPVPVSVWTAVGAASC